MAIHSQTAVASTDATIEGLSDQLSTLYKKQMQSLSDQLSMLYSEREQLEDVLGVSSADDIISLVLCNERDQSLSDQLSMLYSEREQLEEVLGVSSADDIIALVKSFENQLASFYSEGDRLANEDPSHKHLSHEDPSHESPLDMRALAVELVRLRTKNEAANLALLSKLLGYIIEQDQKADASTRST